MAIVEMADVSKTFTVRRRGRGLRRVRGVVHAVRNVSLTMRAGEVVGCIGANGAGKSTMIKMLTGILAPSAGRIRVAGLEPSRDRVRLARKLGVVFGQRTTLWWDLPLIDSFELVRHLYRVPAATYRSNLARLVEVLGLGEVLKTPVCQLSLGQRMRGDLVAAFLHEPELLFLDEPTIGLDVVSKNAVRDVLGRIAADLGTTVLLTTHDLDDIERLCRRVVVIDQGTVAFDGPLETMRAKVAAERILVVDLARPSAPLELPGTRILRVDGVRQWIAFPAEMSASALIGHIAARTEITDLSLTEPDIDDVVRRLYLAARGRNGSVPV